MTQAPLYFIQPHVIERLVTGQFVAHRQQGKSYPMRDRRDTLSPLNVTRRAIRYEPLVFSNRREQIITCANMLNRPENRLMLVSGPTGRGKTAFVRGLVEMMGGGKEQLLWFDVSRHTDFDEIIRFLVEYMTYVFRMAEQEEETDLPAIPEDVNPIATLEKLLHRATDFPILLVIDNVEHLVTQDFMLKSRELKEAFNFLLSFPNIKLILSGRQLPLTDMNPSASAIFHMPLEPLDSDAGIALIKAHLRQPPLKNLDFLGNCSLVTGRPAFNCALCPVVRKESAHPGLGACL